MASFSVHSSTINQNAIYTATGQFANISNAFAPITWYGQISAANNGAYTEYDGEVGGAMTATNMTAPAAADLAALGFLALTSLSLADTNSPQATVTDTLSYSFSTSLPKGTSFYLWDPGSQFNGVPATSTFSFSGASGGQALVGSDFSLTVEYAHPGYPQLGTYTVNANAGSLSVSNYKGAVSPETVVIVTVDKPVDSVTVTANTIGNDVFGFGLAAPGAAVTDTVVGVGGTVVAMAMSSPNVAGTAQSLLNGIGAGIGNGTLVAYNGGGASPTLGGGQSGVQQVDAGGLIAMGATDVGLIDDAVTRVVVFGGAAIGESVVSALGSMVFVASSGSGTVVGGGGDNTFISVAPSAGNFTVDEGAGNDVILTATGSDTIDAGGGNNLVWLGSGTSVITSEGADTVVGQAGAATVTAGATSDLAFGGAGGMDFIGGAQSSTVVGLGGALTVTGGVGGGFFFGGPAGGNIITAGSGKVTIFGGGSGDVLSAGSGSASALLSGGPGAETLTGAVSSGALTFYGGYGPELIQGGSGSNSFVNGPGASTMVGGSGANTYFFLAGRQFSPATIQNFSAGRDLVAVSSYGQTADASVLKSATVVNGSTTITLPDATKVTFSGVAHLTSSSFV